jgi:hypothetical protein
MATTYSLISSVTVGSGGAASIDFTSIPATYTDLVIKISLRSLYSGPADNLGISFNGSTASFSLKLLYGTGTAAASYGSASDNNNVINFSAATATSNTFGNGEIYIPNYAGSSNKSFLADGVSENNATFANQALQAGLRSNTAAITSIELDSGNSQNFVQYSTAYLYGISKA